MFITFATNNSNECSIAKKIDGNWTYSWASRSLTIGVGQSSTFVETPYEHNESEYEIKKLSTIMIKGRQSQQVEEQNLEQGKRQRKRVGEGTQVGSTTWEPRKSGLRRPCRQGNMSKISTNTLPKIHCQDPYPKLRLRPCPRSRPKALSKNSREEPAKTPISEPGFEKSKT